MTGSCDYSHVTTPSLAPHTPSGGRSTILSGSVDQILPTGGNYDVRVRTSRDTFIGGDQSVNPQYSNNIDFNFTQPLLRDFGIDVTRRGITIARNNLGITEGAARVRVCRGLGDLAKHMEHS